MRVAHGAHRTHRETGLRFYWQERLADQTVGSTNHDAAVPSSFLFRVFRVFRGQFILSIELSRPKTTAIRN